MLRLLRRPAALFLLAALLLHGALELGVATDAVRARFEIAEEMASAPCASPLSAPVEEADGCCAEKPKPAPVAHGCSCCGDRCRGGSSCRCGKKSEPAPRGAGLLACSFEPLPCHPGEAAASGAYLPASSAFRFLPPPAQLADASSPGAPIVVPIVIPVGGPSIAPPEPPPDSLSAARA